MKKIFLINSCAKLFALLCVLSLSIGSALGATTYYYYNATAITVSKDGATGQVAVATGAGSNQQSNVISSISPSKCYDGDKEAAGYDANAVTLRQKTTYASTKVTYVKFLAKPDDGSYFHGWFEDEACTIPASNAHATLGDNTYFVFVCSVEHSSTDSNNPSLNTVYAKFSKDPIYQYRTSLTVTSDDASHGQVISSMAELSENSSMKMTQTTIGLAKTTTDDSYTQLYHIKAVPTRGYLFGGWINASSGVEPKTEYRDERMEVAEYNVTATKDTPRDANYDNMKAGTLTASFTAIEDYSSLTVTKDAGKGTVSGFYTYKVAKTNSRTGATTDGIETKTTNFESMGLNESEKLFSDELYKTDQITLTATPATGYDFEGWYYTDERTTEPRFVSSEATYTTTVYGATTYIAKFNVDRAGLQPTEDDKFLVGFSLCQTLEQALAAASSSEYKTILLLQDYTVPSGNYTIPAGVKLLIPCKAEQTNVTDVPTGVSASSAITGAYRTLTLSEGVTLNVQGDIEVSGEYFDNGTGATGTGRPNGPTYGHMIMNKSSKIIMNNGSELRVWGFITGSGEIDARRGAIVREMFQLYDFKGGTLTLAMFENPGHVFPLNQYYIQNVEVKTTYRPGSALYGVSAYKMAIMVKIIGVSTDKAALFMMDDADDSDDTWVCKWYDASCDRQVYEINNNAYLSNLEVNFGTYGQFNSSNYILPITNNMTIHLLSGEMHITQSTILLPGAQIEANKKSTVYIEKGNALYLYDTEEWGKYVYNGAYAVRVGYRPGGVYNRNVSSAAALGDASINVHGSLDAYGKIYSSEHGANIFSSINDAGTITFYSDAANDTTISHPTEFIYHSSLDGEVIYSTQKFVPVLLKNQNENYTETAGTTATEEDPVSFCFIDFDGDGKGEWKSLTVVDDIFVKDENDVYYIKPGAYVPIKQGSKPEEQDDYTYHDEYNNSGRMFILATGNQWWEVTQVGDNLFKCEHPNNTTYYYYDELDEGWLEKKFKVTWLNWDGKPIKYYSALAGDSVNYYYVTYNTVPDWKGSTPTHEADSSHTYSFSGWLPTPAPVTEDVTYVAQFAERDRMYAITFNDKNDELIQLVYCKLGEVPVCSKHELAANEQWSPAVGAVAGDQTYKLAAKNNDGPFTIKFVNWDGTPIGEAQSVIKNATPVAPADPTKEDDDLHSYTFAGWTPDVTAATADATYTATYTTAPRTNDIVLDANGSQNLNDAATLKDNLIITSDGSSSGQLFGASKLTLKGDAVFKLATTIPARTWYAVAAPWKVDVRTGIYANGNRLTVGRDFDIIEFDAEAYASGDSGEKNRNIWKYVEENGGVMIPGKLYMIYLASEKSSLEFHRTTGSTIFTTTISLSTTGGNVDRANWNAIANPALYHANLGISVIEDNSNDILQYTNGSYTPATASNMIVGKPIFVQVNNSQSIVFAALAGVAGMPAYRRAPQTATDNRFVVEITRDGQMNDRIIVQTAEEKADEYVIGKDLAKIGVGTKAAQMWMERYNTQLCKNTLEMKGEQVDYPLNLYAPAAGEYILTAAQERGEATLYLTRNDKPVWNLSYGEYVLNLEKGTTTEYGLRLVSKVPQITTGIGNVQGEDAPCTKVLRDGVIYILRGNNVYSIDGQLVK